EAHGAQPASRIDELGGENAAVGDLLAVTPELLVDDPELVAFADVEREVDVPAKDAGDVHDQLVGQAGVVAGLVKGRANRVAGDLDDALDRQFDFAREEAALLANHFQPLLASRRRGQSDDLAVLLGADLYHVARMQAPQA